MEASIAGGIAIVSNALTILEQLERRSKKIREYVIKKKKAFEFHNYSRQLTILPNGHGVVLNTFRIKVYQLNKFKSFTRWMTLFDAQNSTKFPSETIFTKQNIANRYSHYGMWHNHAHLISIDKYVVSRDGKRLDWNFKIDQSNMPSLWPYYIDISYAFSIPGLFPIRNGYWYKKETSKGYTNEQSTTLSVEHIIKELNYTIQIDQKVHLQKEPEFIIIPEDHDPKDYKDGSPLKLIERNVIYNKYEYNVTNPAVGSKLKISWEIEKLKRKK